MKGIELPINTLIIIVIALTILLALIALFYGVWTPGSSGLNLDATKNTACHMLVSTGCSDTTMVYINNFDADKDGNLNEQNSNIGDCGLASAGDNLFMLCKCWYNVVGNDDDIELACKQNICNCK